MISSRIERRPHCYHECAALIGRRFRANMLAEIFKMDEIVLLDRLRKQRQLAL